MQFPKSYCVPRKLPKLRTQVRFGAARRDRSLAGRVRKGIPFLRERHSLPESCRSLQVTKIEDFHKTGQDRKFSDSCPYHLKDAASRPLVTLTARIKAHAHRPPSIVNTWPLMYAAASLARNNTP